MYIKVDWENQTVKFMNDSEAEKLLHSPLAVYYVNEDWFSIGPECFDTVEEALQFLMSPAWIDDVAFAAYEDDWFIEQHPDWDIDKGMEDLVENHKNWLYDFLVHYAADILFQSYADCHYELIKIPKTVS